MPATTTTRTPVTSFRLAPVWPNVQMWALKSEFSGRMTALPYRLDVIQSERLTGRFDGICLVPGLRCGPDDPRPYIPNGFTQTGEPAGKLDPNAPLSGLVLLDVDRKQDGDTAVPPHLLDHPHVAAWGYSKTGTGCHILIWVPELAGLPAGSGAYKQGWQQCADWLESETGLTADPGRSDASGLMRQSSNPLHVDDDPEPFPLARLEPPSTVEPRPQTTLDRALTDNPTLWGRVGKLAGHPNLHEGDQPCPRPDHTHTSNSTLGIGPGNIWAHRSNTHPEPNGGDAVRLVWFLQGNDTKPVGDDYRNLEAAIQDALGLGMTAVDTPQTVDADGDRLPEPVRLDLNARHLPGGEIILNGSGPQTLYVRGRQFAQGVKDPHHRAYLTAHEIDRLDQPTEPYTLAAPDPSAPAVDYLLDGTGPPLAVDLTTLAGEPDTGKSSAAAAVLAARPTLRAVYLTDEAGDYQRQRLADWHPHPNRIRIGPIPRIDQDPQAAAAVQHHRPGLIVVDHWADYCAIRHLDENDATAARRMIDHLHQLADRTIPILMLAHQRKRQPQDRTSDRDRIRGSGNLAAKSSVVLIAAPRPTDRPTATIRVNRVRTRPPTTERWDIDLSTGGLAAATTEQLLARQIAERTNRGAAAVREAQAITGGPVTITDIRAAPSAWPNLTGPDLQPAIDGGLVETRPGRTKNTPRYWAT